MLRNTALPGGRSKTDDSNVIGIDLGTTYSCVAVFQNGEPKVVPNGSGKTTTPSYVAFENSDSIVENYQTGNRRYYHNDGDEEPNRIVGDQAKDGAYADPQNTIFAIKRVIGRKFNENEVKVNMSRWPFKLVNVNGLPAVQVTEKGVCKTVFPEEISAEVIRTLKSSAEDFLGKKVSKAVITVPANFCDSQKKATKAAGEMAGLEVIGIINEPTAAAVAYGLQNRMPGEQIKTILVFDFGGGTLDVSIITAMDKTTFKVLATAGDMHFGGEDFDERILEYLASEFENLHGPGLRKHAPALSNLRNHAEQAKKALSGSPQAKVAINSLYKGITFKATVTRTQFENVCADLFARVLAPVQEALAGAKLRKENIGQVVLVGGSSRIPKVVDILKEFFTVQQIFRDINPDEAIARGAAAYAHTLEANAGDIKIADIISHSLGVELADKSMLVILPRYTPVPAKACESTVTAFDYQTEADFRIYQGEKFAVASQNRLWGSVQLHDVRSAPKGEVEMPVTFEYDNSGLLHVHVEENNAHKKNSGYLEIKLA